MTTVEFLQTWVPLAVGILSILTILGGIIYRIHKKFTVYIKEEIASVAKEFKPNGGSSLKDQVNRLETGHNDIVNEVNSVKDEISEIKEDNKRLESKLDKMFDTLLDIASKFGK
jgi:predicted nuclease with TOPRIM domain